MRNQPHERETGHRLSGAGFAHDTERLAFLKIERDTMHYVSEPSVCRKRHLKITDRKQSSLFFSGHDVFLIRGSSASRSPSPSKFRAISMTAMSVPGAN